MIKSSENKISEECIKPNRKYHPEIGVQFKTGCFIYAQDILKEFSKPC